MIRFYASALEEVDVPLACDPLVQERNDALVLARYSVDGDRAGLVVPPGATVARLRPLSAQEIQACGVDAGSGSHLGAIVEGEIAEALQRERVEAWKAAEAALEPEDRALLNAWRDEGRGDDHPGAQVGHRVIGEVADRVRRARARAIDDLPPASAAALREHEAWERRRDDAMLRRGWLGMAGWVDEQGRPMPQARLVDCLGLVRPLGLQRDLRGELVQHLMRMSTLEPLGKASSPSGSTEGILTPSTPGPARTASDAASGGSEGTAVLGG